MNNPNNIGNANSASPETETWVDKMVPKIEDLNDDNVCDVEFGGAEPEGGEQ